MSDQRMRQPFLDVLRGLAVVLMIYTHTLNATWGWPSWLPAPLAAYLYGPRPLAYFPLIPWIAFALLGLALGDAWQRVVRGGDPDGTARRRAMIFAALGAALVYGLALLLG